MKDKILRALNWRYAVKEFNSQGKLPRDLVETIIESGRLAPSSYGIESWHIYHVIDQSVRDQLLEVSYDQAKVANASDLLVITTISDGINLADRLADNMMRQRDQSREDVSGLIDMIKDSVHIKRNDDSEICWLKSQTYIMLGFMIYTAAMLGVDACPMEGFKADEVGKILDLPDSQIATTMLTLGYRSPDDELADKPKVRQDLSSLVTIV